MTGSLAREIGSTGLMIGGFYSVVITTIFCPPAGLGIAAAGALWLYGKAKH